MILADKFYHLKGISLVMWYALMLTMLLGCSVSQAPKIEAITGLSMGTSYTVKWVQRVDQKKSNKQ